MSGGPRFYDSGAYIKGAHSSMDSITAGGAGDNVAITGQSVDRLGFGSGSLLINFKATLAQAATLTVTVQRQDSDDGTTWNAATTLKAASVVATGPTGGGTVRDCIKVKDSYEVAARYVRYLVTPDLSAANTDTAQLGSTVVLGGAYNGTTLPVS